MKKNENAIVVKNVYKTNETGERVEQIKKLLLKGIERKIKLGKMI